MTLMLPCPDPPLADGTVVLRTWRHGDLECVRGAASDPRIPAGTTVPAVYTPEAGAAFIDRQLSRQVHGEGLSLAIADAATDTALGLIALLFREDRAVLGLGYWIVPEARGNGLARHAVALLAPWAVRQPGIREVEALVEPHNAASVRIVERTAFVRDGVLTNYLGAERDVYRYVLRRPSS